MGLFEPKVRDRAIETACSNLVLARQIRLQDMVRYMELAVALTDVELAQVLVGSRILYEAYLENCWNLN